MDKRTITLNDGREVEAVFTYEVLMQIASKIPGKKLTALSKGNIRDISSLMTIFAFMINTGEKNAGRECNLTAEDLKRLLAIKDISVLLEIITVQTQSFTSKPVFFRGGKTGQLSGSN